MSNENGASRIIKSDQARNMNFQSCHLLTSLMKTSIGPFGSIKLLESDKGELGLTKDGGDLLKQLTIVHPTALFIARAAFAQEKMFHDGVSSIITLIDAILEQCEYRIDDGIHPRVITKGLEEGRSELLKYIDEISIKTPASRSDQKDIVSSGSLTKTSHSVSDVVVDAINCVREESKPIDLDRIDVMKIKSTKESVRLIHGLVIDQGYRHENMPKRMKDVRILALNVSLEMEPTAVNTIMPVANEDQRERMTIAERKFVDDKVRAIIELKNVIGTEFLLVNGKGIDGPSLDILSRANISALRRVSRKTLNRLVHSCGCHVINCVDDLNPQVLGFAGTVNEENHRGAKYVFIDEVKEPKAVSIVIGGMTELSMNLTEVGVRDGLRALKQAINDGKVLPGAGATQIALSLHLQDFKKTLKGKERIGIEILSDALLALPRTLIQNSGLDAPILLQEMLQEASSGELAGIDLEAGEVMDPTIFGIYDNYAVIRGMLSSAPIVASQLLLVDEIIDSGKVRKENPKEAKESQ